MVNLFLFKMFRRIRLKEVRLISFCLILPVVVFGCEPEETYPMKVSFETYLPYETVCNGVDFADDEVCIVNSEKQLKSHIVCEDIKLPKVNFAKHSLLLVKGSSSCGISDINVSLSKEEADKYIMGVTVFTNMSMEAPSWLISIITPKIKDTDIITLNVKQINS